jgi:hypothetical protein
LDRLLSLYLDAALADADQRAFLALLDDPECAARFLDAVRLDREISGLLAKPVRSDKMAELVFSDINHSGKSGSSERRLFGKSIAPRIARRRSQRSFSSAAAAIVTLAAGILLFIGLTSERQETSDSDESLGTVESAYATTAFQAMRTRENPDGRSQDRLTAGMTLQAGDRIETGGDGSADRPRLAGVLFLFGSATVQLAEGSLLTILNGGDAPALRLESGRVFVDASQLSQSGRHLHIQTPCGEAVSEGTRFEVFSAKDRTAVKVEEGQVRFSNAHGERRLGAMQSSQSGPDSAPSQAVEVTANDIWQGIQPHQHSSTQNGLIAHWALDETSDLLANDASPNGRTAILRNGATWTEGRLGGALSLDGIDDFAQFEPLRLAGDFTLSVWVWSEQFRPEQTIIGNDQTTTVLGYDHWDVPEGCIRFGDNGGNFVRWQLRPPLQEWHHVVVVYKRDEGIAELTLDGAPCDVQPFHGDFMSPNTQLRYIGRSYSLENCMFKGRIDDVRIYDRALSRHEILGLFHTVDQASGKP